MTLPSGIQNSSDIIESLLARVDGSQRNCASQRAWSALCDQPFQAVFAILVNQQELKRNGNQITTCRMIVCLWRHTHSWQSRLEPSTVFGVQHGPNETITFLYGTVLVALGKSQSDVCIRDTHHCRFWCLFLDSLVYIWSNPPLLQNFQINPNTSSSHNLNCNIRKSPSTNSSEILLRTEREDIIISTPRTGCQVWNLE